MKVTMRARFASLALAVVFALTLVLATAAHASGGLKVSFVSESSDGTSCTVIVQADWHPKSGQALINFALQNLAGASTVFAQEEPIQAFESAKTETFVVPTTGVFVVAAQVRNALGEELAAAQTKTPLSCF